MSEKLLLLSEAKSGVLVGQSRKRPHWVRRVSIAIGVFVILVGFADVAERFSSKMRLGDISVAFAPAITIVDPSVLEQVRGVVGTSTIPLVPTRIKIASLGVDARVVPVKDKDGSMDSPKKFNEVAWYEPGSKVGDAGNAVFAGHVNNALTSSGVFSHLSLIKRGDTIEISDAQGKMFVYRVSEVANYPTGEAPSGIIFTKEGPSGVVLITCDGDWDSGERSFSQRLVVFAKPVF